MPLQFTMGVPGQLVRFTRSAVLEIRGEDFIRTTLRYRDRTGEIYTFRSNAEQRWYYYPLMHPDEVLLLKCYDSETDGRARFVAHTSFEDPTSLPDAPARKSIEVRTIAFFD